MNKNYIIEEVESCELIGHFEDEYVYDVEVDDDTHTFIANDILVHNSLFVSFEPAIKHCEWRDLVVKQIDNISDTFVFLEYRKETKTNNSNCLGYFRSIDDLKEFLKSNKPSILVIDGYFVKNRTFNSEDFQSLIKGIEIRWNWDNELDFIHGIDAFRYGYYFKNCLEEYAGSYGVKNREDFELERVSESIINLAKKKYIQHIVYEDGIPYDRLTYIFPKGVELVRSSTPSFAREKIAEIVKYLFAHPDDFNIKELLKLVKNLRKEFELADVDDICMQSSCSNYDSKVLEDKTKLEFVSGAHFAVKSAAYYNYLLHQNKGLQSKYEFIKSGTKIKYYYCKNKKINDMFAFIRGSYPIEFAPEIDYDEQFMKSILSPINSIIAPLGLPTITARLSVILDIFGNF